MPVSNLQAAGRLRMAPDGSVRRHEDREAEAGQMMQRLVDADQRPEPGMLQVTPNGGDESPLARSTVMWMAKSMKATNQNRGATIRISASATAR